MLAIFPLWGAEKGNAQLMALARPMTYGLFFTLTIAFAALFYLFAVNDFSVQYVVNTLTAACRLLFVYLQFGVHMRLIITLDLVINTLGRSRSLI